jgi:hypothetical protein
MRLLCGDITGVFFGQKPPKPERDCKFPASDAVKRSKMPNVQGVFAHLLPCGNGCCLAQARVNLE